MDNALPFNGPFLNSCEMYPQRRTTEFYRSVEPRASYQSRQAEHPNDILNEVPDQNRELAVRLPRIQPPNNSDKNLYKDFVRE
ncbi:uncharacterized protein LOC108107645 [Drosophila eugracilis]|uniref:uncharacterized protein LOC108107645 n=1 Tax=Drosophila eugracilis TaxID=29029 RepID=UPI0007E67703|nr:uncharacterized protein LOC108107645 [Drosophila eugracilis]